MKSLEVFELEERVRVLEDALRNLWDASSRCEFCANMHPAFHAQAAEALKPKSAPPQARHARISDLLMAVHDAWVEYEVALATGSPETYEAKRKALIAAHQALRTRAVGNTLGENRGSVP